MWSTGDAKPQGAARIHLMGFKDRAGESKAETLHAMHAKGTERSVTLTLLLAPQAAFLRSPQDA
jgi:hypothetical protein